MMATAQQQLRVWAHSYIQAALYLADSNALLNSLTYRHAQEYGNKVKAQADALQAKVQRAADLSSMQSTAMQVQHRQLHPDPHASYMNCVFACSSMSS
jgi:hypothetical protein